MKFFECVLLAGAGLVLAACANDKDMEKEFNYSIDEFADIEVLRYEVPGWESLSLRQKEYVYYLCEAAKAGRDIIWDQNFKYNLQIRKVLEAIISGYEGDRDCPEFGQFLIYAKRVFFSNGIHHHYAEFKIIPECPQDYFRSLMDASGVGDQAESLLPVLYDPDLYAQHICQDARKDIVTESAGNFYDGVTRSEADAFYRAMTDPNDPEPISYGLNSKLVKADGKVYEDVYRIGGLYGEAIGRVVGFLRQAREVAENDMQKEYTDLLIEYYTTGDLKLWDAYNIAWVKDTGSKVDYVNGFVEDYDDPLGRKASWEAIVNYRDDEASHRTEVISANAQWFEDNSPVDARFKKKEVKGVSAKVINVACIAGDNYPATAIGINLPNANWIRKEHGSKSVTIANITEAYGKAANQRPHSVVSEFAWDREEIDRARRYGSVTDDLHTDLHECLGHGSGQMLEGVSETALGEYNSTLEEARADLFALYYIADGKLVELGLLDSRDAYKASYDSYIRNGHFTQFSRIEPGNPNTEAHMQNRKLIADWCIEKGAADNVVETRVRDGKTYFVITDYEKLRGLFGELLAEVQRIKSEGDYEAGKALVEGYAVDIDPDLHREVLERYASLDLKPYKGFVNPEIVPVIMGGEVTDYEIVYVDDFLDQQMKYGRDYSFLKATLVK